MPGAAARRATAQVPALGAVEQRYKMAEIDPLQRRPHRGIVEVLRPLRIAHGRAQRAERQIRPLRHEHHLVAGAAGG